ncbi:hypothetical protein BCU30_018200 [Vibrio lentus]|uniref:hypothetical protein n=1 Tax=Vibrio lentus TaxID=136468 RepID=UPI000C8251CF|nr:hypothetical protein [Vibrio lentus]PMG23172.1 hypothetical protein BCU96_14090 [Vibrio lentus]PMH13326.1 hypothetical protein BCU76_22035 [Vibrio lentus]PMJ12981.1 hypothetical protein BCU30_12815 [Vibrio lentus]PMK95610.1 hypothetical protein BCT89_13810 [Vibrio lentus]PML48190.1 hypothetical protein BCT75_20560 [Vibrio lentus]
MKIAYHYDYKTLVYQSGSQIHKVAGYDEYILPQFATFVEVPKLDIENEQARFDEQNQKWTVEPKFIEVTAYHKQTHETKNFDDVSLITDDYTKDKPATQWDGWIDGSWVTNKSTQYIAECNQVDNVRRRLYAQICDPLIAEANIKRLQGFEDDAQTIEAQALAARDKIQAENPWPTQPTN